LQQEKKIVYTFRLRNLKKKICTYFNRQCVLSPFIQVPLEFNRGCLLADSADIEQLSTFFWRKSNQGKRHLCLSVRIKVGGGDVTKVSAL
jgi:hypothetical protein